MRTNLEILKKKRYYMAHCLNDKHIYTNTARNTCIKVVGLHKVIGIKVTWFILRSGTNSK